MITPQRLGFVGLGNMGFPMAARLVEAGFRLVVYDLKREAQERFLRHNQAVGADSPAEVARQSDLVITMLPNGEAVKAIVLGPDGNGVMAEVMAPGSIIVDMSSSSPLGTRELGQILAAKNIHLMDAPVSGGVAKAKNGTLAIMVGGTPELLEVCRPVLAAMGERIFFSGPLGSGHAVKALNNLLSAAGFIAATEVLLLGRSFGIDPQVMNDILNASTGRNNSTENKMERFVLARAFSSGFSLDLMVKDLNTAMDLAHEMGVPAIFSNLCRELWTAAQCSLGRGLDGPYRGGALVRGAGSGLLAALTVIYNHSLPNPVPGRPAAVFL
jgi:3-hydroxyisobutyrate dehydrogenase